MTDSFAVLQKRFYKAYDKVAEATSIVERNIPSGPNKDRLEKSSGQMIVLWRAKPGYLGNISSWADSMKKIVDNWAKLLVELGYGHLYKRNKHNIDAALAEVVSVGRDADKVAAEAKVIKSEIMKLGRQIARNAEMGMRYLKLVRGKRGGPDAYSGLSWQLRYIKMDGEHIAKGGLGYGFAPHNLQNKSNAIVLGALELSKRSDAPPAIMKFVNQMRRNVFLVKEVRRHYAVYAEITKGQESR